MIVCVTFSIRYGWMDGRMDGEPKNNGSHSCRQHGDINKKWNTRKEVTSEMRELICQMDDKTKQMKFDKVMNDGIRLFIWAPWGWHPTGEKPRQCWQSSWFHPRGKPLKPTCLLPHSSKSSLIVPDYTQKRYGHSGRLPAAWQTRLGLQ